MVAGQAGGGIMSNPDQGHGTTDAADVPAMLQAALAHHQAGRLVQAEAFYRQILEAEPGHADALHLLGMIALQEGKLDNAVDLIGRAIHANPLNPMCYLNLGIALEDQGKLDAAIDSFRKTLELKPDYAEALVNLGNVFQKQDKLDAAAEHYREALSLKPGYAEVHSNLGNILRTQGKLDEAIESHLRALALKPDYAEAHYNLANALRDQGRPDEAIARYQQALALQPDHAEAHCNLGLAFQHMGDMDKAIEHFLHALSLKPDHAEAHNNLGNALNDKGKPKEAIAHYLQALASRPEFAEAHNNLGNVLLEQGRLDEALEHYHKALSLKPDYADAHAALAGIHIDFGRFDEAQLELTRALELQSEHPVAWALLVRLRKMTPADTDWLDTALRLLARSRPPLSTHETITMQFALGKYYDDTKQYDLAFDAYRQGNLLRRERREPFYSSSLSRFFDALIATCSAESMNRQREGANQSERPVLVVGMPRSGTSLVEQIIASHPEAIGAGELKFWGAHGLANRESVMSDDYKPEFLSGIAGEYEQLLQRYSDKAARIVDKMPSNFVWLSFIRAVFPQAKIIHTQRNPVDTCLSVYFQNFDSSHSYATDLDDLVYYYREYDRLMRHWRSVLPADRFLEVPYEALVDDQETWSRRIIEFLGLEWDERCLEFHKTERKVGTSSNWQVRQKIYRTSKERWRNYEKHLGPLRALLDETEG
jgi:tetratricopeptide (TPR) repeat protein